MSDTLTSEQVAEKLARAEKGTPCAKCRGTRKIAVKQGMTFETDSREERALSFRIKPCPDCVSDVPALCTSHELQRAENERLNSHIQQIAASHQSNTESLLEVARERDALKAENARVTALESLLNAAGRGKATAEHRLSAVCEQRDLLKQELKEARSIPDAMDSLQRDLAALKQENAELRAALRKTLTLAEEGIAHPEAGDHYFHRIASELRAAVDGRPEAS